MYVSGKIGVFARVSLAGLMLGFAFPALAASQQPVADAGQSVASSPSVTTATYGSWVLRCVTLDKGNQGQPAANAAADAGTPAKTCEIVQTVQVQGQTQPVAEVALGHIGSDPALVMTAVVPSNITIPGRIRIATDVKEGADNAAGFDMTWARCAGGACFATAKPGTDDLAKMKSGKAGSIALIDAAGRNVAIPISWAGISQAIDALEAQK